MTRRTIASDNRVGGGGSRFPKLEFKNKDERHRVLLFQKDPMGQAYVWQEYVHVLRVPKFKDDGFPKMAFKQSKRNEDEKYEDYDTDWLGSPLCLGDVGTDENPGRLVTEGYDPVNCPVCAAIDRDAPVEAKLFPQLTFAVNVVEYALANNSWNVQRPLSAKVVIWRLNASTYDDIISQQDQHGELLQKQDLTLEVISPSFRTAKMGVMAPSGWQESPNGGAYLQELLSTPGNIATDEQLRAACGREAKRIFMQEDLATVLKKWRKAKLALEGAEDPASTAALGGQQSLAAGIAEVEAQPDPAVTAQQVAQMRDEARAEVSQIVQGDPFAAAAQAVDPASPFGEFTKDGNHQIAAEQQAAQVMSAQPASDPFAVTGASGQAAAQTTQPASPPAAAAGTPTAPPSDPFAAAASIPVTPAAASPEPTAAPSPVPGTAEPVTGKAVSFEDMIASLEKPE